VELDAAPEPADAAEAVHDATTESTPVLSSQQGLTLELRPRGPCWVSASADGRLVVYRLMQPGEHATVDAHEEIELRVGDAGAFAFAVNGVPGRTLGRSGQVVTLRITNGNYQALQATAPQDGEARADVPL
jgi:hypothetical protein